jgi:hypothetical protein
LSSPIFSVSWSFAVLSFCDITPLLYIKEFFGLISPRRGRCGRDRMVVGFPTTYAISAYHYWSYEFESHSGKVYSMQHYVIKFVNNLWQVSGFLWVLQFPPPIKLTTMIYNWNIVECGVKHHNTKPPPISPKHHYDPFWYIYPNYDLKLYQYIYFELHVYYLFCWICIIDLRQDDLLYKHLNCMMTSLMFVLYGVHSEVVSITWCNPCLFIHIAFKN